VSAVHPWRFFFLGYQAGFGQPTYLLLCPLILLLGGFALHSALRRRGWPMRVVSERLLARLVPGISILRPAAQAGLYTLGLALIAFALAQPQCGTRAELTKRRGIDLVVALDASKSMFARDVQPNRLERAKLELLTLLDELKGDRVGIVVFAGDAFIQCPLTSDYAAAKMFLRAVDPEQMQQGGTNIGGALMLAKQVLEGAERGAKDRVVVLLSDGEDLEGQIKEATEALREAAIRVYAVGIGSETGEPIPLLSKKGEVVGYQKGPDGETVLTRLDRQGLAMLAQETDGEFFYEPRGVAMSQVVPRIDQLQKSDIESRLTVMYDERFQYFAAPGCAALLLGMALRTSRQRST